MIPVLVFDIETIPDTAGIRVLHELPATLSESEVAEYAFQKQRAKNGSDFLPHHLQRVAVISCAMRSDEVFKVCSLAEPKMSVSEFDAFMRAERERWAKVVKALGIVAE